MMSKTKVCRDRHGLYARSGGYVWRPDFPADHRSNYDSETVLDEGSPATITHPGGPVASVRSGDIREQWFSHGSYFRASGTHVDSEEIFRPAYECW